MLPVWNLKDFYSDYKSNEIENDLKKLQDQSLEFSKKYQTKIASLTSEELYEAISDYEKLQELCGKLLSYAELYHAQDMSNDTIAAFYQTVQEKVNSLSSQILFFNIELNKIEDQMFEHHINSTALLHYKSWLKELRLFRAHQLSEEIEKLLYERSIVGRASWVRLFNETITSIKINLNQKTLSLDETLNLLSNKDEDQRRQAGEQISKALARHIKTFSLITNVLAKDKEIDDTWRHYPHPLAARNLSNQVEDKTVEILVNTVIDFWPRLSHRYYKLKAQLLKKEHLNYWDRLAPFPFEDDQNISWDTAKNIVLESYTMFSPEMAKIGKRFFDNNWIDAALRPGKSPGAFAHPTVPSLHPYLLVNYHGKSRDVMTLAHELGHGVHQMLAAKQGMLLSDTPLTLAETASVFGEMLVFRKLLSQTIDPKARFILLASKIEDMLNTVVRQIAFHEFERQIHMKRRKSELTPEQIGEIWLDIQKRSLGPVFQFHTDYQYYWSYIPHFIHTPFYVYAYAFGDCLVNSLYAVYQKDNKNFIPKYFMMLEAGGTKRYDELLESFDLQPKDPLFWANGLKIVEQLIDELASIKL
ncbi:MAG: M3 family oligoendopeptidase [Alphaproteobacteria bacterium]|nr:M3 family oligoendopeptidase [Alphaproteobacteria bacterium]